MKSTIRPLAAGRRGFTLVEIILVVAIIMTLVGLVGPKLATKARRARINATKIMINGNLKTALGQFEVNVGRFPTTAEGLKALVERPSEIPEATYQDAYMETMPKDGWGKEFRYVCPSEKQHKDFDIISAGPDGKFDTPDDINNDPADMAVAPADTTTK